MNNLWSKVVKDGEQVKSALAVGHELRELLLKYIEVETKALDGKRNYEEDNWALREADRKGQKHMLEKIKKMLGEK